MVREYYELGEASAIVFIDEGNEFVMTDKFASIIQKTDNYYVIVTRENIPLLPYSIEEIYRIRNSGKYGTLTRTYNEFYRLYRITDYNEMIQPQIIITEDSNSGYQFFQGISEKINKLSCISAGGKSNIFKTIILKSGVIKEPGILELLQHPEVEIESSRYVSWGRYFTALLVGISDGTYLKYNKRNLNPAYMQEKISQKLLAVMPFVDWN